MYDSNTILYNSSGTAISTLSYNPALLYEGLFASTPLNPGNYYVLVNKGSQATIDPYEMVLNFTGLSGDVKPLDDTINLPRQITQPPTDTPNPLPTTIVVEGEIGKKYNNMGGETSWLGKPMKNAISLGNGVIQQNFADGYIIYNGKTAVAYLVGNGKPNVTAPSSQPTANFVSPLNWKAEFINRTPSNAGDINFNIDRKNGQPGVFAQIPNPAAVSNLGSQGGNGKIKAILNANFGLNSPANNVQSDNFGMLASTQVSLEAGKTYKFTTKSDDGSALNLKNLTTGQWMEEKDILISPEFGNADWRARGYKDPAKTVLFKVAQSSEYQLMFKLYDGTGAAQIEAKVEEVFQDPVDISKDWRQEVYKWDQGQNTQPPADIQTATTAGNGLEYMGRVSAGSNTRSDGTKGTRQDKSWNWGQGSPNHNDQRFPNDKFVVKGVTEADFKANQTYKFTVRANDGYQLYARYQDGTKEPITPDNQWQKDAYNSKTIDFKPKKDGKYTVVAYMFENTGDAFFDLSWKEIPSEPPLFPNPTPSNPLVGFKHPLQGAGSLTQGPGGSTSHIGRAQYAIDYGVQLGTPVYAMRSGIVKRVIDEHPDTGGGKERANYANLVTIEHDGGYRSAYLHLEQGFISKVSGGIKEGQNVQAGQLIGYSGNSGWSTGNHLHVEVHRPNSNGTNGQTVPFKIS